MTRARAPRQLLEQVRMNDVPRRLRQYPHELSGGMRQRAMIAMALACDPQAADRRRADHGAGRVGAGADPGAAARSSWRERGMALAVVTHDMGVIAALADEVVVMREGRVVERARSRACSRRREHEYTRALLAATPRVDDAGRRQRRAVQRRPREHRSTVRDLRRASPTARGWLARVAATCTAVDGVSLDVAAGEALGIVGESGCGKSTLTRALLRLGPVTAGEIVWLGRPIQDLQGEELRGAARTACRSCSRIRSPASIRP